MESSLQGSVLKHSSMDALWWGPAGYGCPLHGSVNPGDCKITDWDT